MSYNGESWVYCKNNFAGRLIILTNLFAAVFFVRIAVFGPEELTISVTKVDYHTILLNPTTSITILTISGLSVSLEIVWS